MFFPSLVQYRYRGGIFLLPVTELSLKPAILAGNEGVMLLLGWTPLRPDREHR